MTRPELFSLEKTELHPGQSLIEASAGTGKTYTIAGLFLRLVVERDFSVREILAVTFTVAATEELRGRIRQMLVETRDAFERDTAPAPFIQVLVKRFGRGNEQKIRALDQAILDFDQAPIHTIHSFCQRTLLDHAFESGNMFQRELVADMQPVLLDVLNDLWRKHVLSAGALPIACALKAGLAPESFSSFAVATLRHRTLRVLAPERADRIGELVQELETAFAALKRTWRDQKHVIRAFFGSDAEWANRPYNDDAAVEAQFAAVAAALENDEVSPEALGALEMFTCENLEGKRNKRLNLPAPQHTFFSQCSAFVAAQEKFVTGLHLRALEFIRTELRTRTEQLSAWTFDDLINHVLDALEGPGGRHLVKLLRSKYKAALVDEFQDTDPVQYAIFRRVFGDNESFLLLVGDPKQAIYGFRGADIFTYLKAAETVHRRYTLEFNWRAAPGLVKAINTFFSVNPNAFVFDRIRFYPVKAAGSAEQLLLMPEGKPAVPLVIWLWRRTAKRIRKADLETHIAGAVAGEIVRLVTGKTRFGTRPVEPADIAVLVPENRQAQLMQRALSALNIPSVLYTTESLFQSHETDEIQCVLAAIASPNNEPAIKAALATDMLGFTAEQITALVADEAAWQNVLARFHEYLDIWLGRGFIQMYRTLLARERVRERLLQFADGERRVTNLLHLGEVLHTVTVGHQLGPSSLLKWVAQQKTRPGLAREEHQLRLERDEKAVKLVTIHRSKGLEYPIVFCPFSWSGLKNDRSRNRMVWFHNPDSGELTLDLGSKQFEQNVARGQLEALAEDVRLLYVALTRAKYRCYFVWGPFDGAATSAPAWLLHMRKGTGSNPDDVVQHATGQLDEKELLDDLNKLVAGADDTIALADLPEPGGEPLQMQQAEPSKLAPRTFTGRIQRDWRIASFSSITASKDADQPDYDPVWLPEPLEAELAAGIFAFPRGVRAGECLHRIFEMLDFTRWHEPDTKNLIADQLAAYGIPPQQFCDVVFQMLGNVLATPLMPPANGSTDVIRLEKISADRRLTELEFCFPLGRLAPEPLLSLLAKHGVLSPQEPDRFSFNPVTGVLKGYIDLVFEWQGRFYIVDWKSNWLGNCTHDYNPAALQAEILQRNYFLQYQLYTVALDKYLRLRMPNYDYQRNFGGVFYIFVRGVDPARPELGVYRDKPPHELIRDLAKLLAVQAESGRAK